MPSLAEPAHHIVAEAWKFWTAAAGNCRAWSKDDLVLYQQKHVGRFYNFSEVYKSMIFINPNLIA
jgi:hypothetical protein